MVSLGRKSIYLAGKITPWSKYNEDDWRFSIIPQLTHYVTNQWIGDWTNGNRSWSFLPRAIFDKFDYVGPFFTSLEDNYGGHGGGLCYPHGVDVTESPRWKHKHDTPELKIVVTVLCLDAIRRADLVFAWIESRDCYGTLFELGYANALGKEISLHLAPSFFLETSEKDDEDDAAYRSAFDDFWFPYFACEGQVAQVSPRDALQDAITNLGWEAFPDSFDSPLEANFAQEWLNQSLHLVYPLSCQHNIKDGKYRLDFAYEPLKVGIELDGYTYHSDREAFTRDRQRQREIEAQGWHIIRFSSDELAQDIGRCVREAAHYLGIQKHQGV
jgi:very-short-patch-repair endonuclease